MQNLIFTIGHSTRTFEAFTELLEAHKIEQLMDVRTLPHSRRYPHFNRESLAKSLPKRGIAYTHNPQLGGLRKPKANSINMGWRNEGFRGYADHMQTPDFDEGLNRAITLAKKKRVALMCAEAVPWRCHRNLISDALTIRGFRVEDIQSSSKTLPHQLTPWAKVVDAQMTYPALQPSFFLNICDPTKVWSIKTR